MTDDSGLVTNGELSMTSFEFDWATDLPMAIGIFSTENQAFVAANPEGLSLFGWTSADLGVVTLWDIVAVFDWSLLRLEVARSSKTDEEIYVPAGGFLTFQRKDSTKFAGWFQVKDLPDPSGEARYRVAIVIPNDSSSDAEAYWDLKAKKDQDDLVALFSGTAAHEVNNALAVIYGLLKKLNVPSENLTDIMRPLEKIKRIGKVLSEAGSRGFDVASLDGLDGLDGLDSEISSNRTSRSVLLVDDQPELLDVLHEVLHGAGYAVVKTKNLQEARDQASAHHFDFAVIDVQLGTDLGTDLALELQQSSPSTQIVLMSGFSHHFERYKDTLDMKFLRKPFAMGTLLSALASVGKK